LPGGGRIGLDELRETRAVDLLHAFEIEQELPVTLVRSTPSVWRLRVEGHGEAR